MHIKIIDLNRPQFQMVAEVLEVTKPTTLAAIVTDTPQHALVVKACGRARNMSG